MLAAKCGAGKGLKVRSNSQDDISRTDGCPRVKIAWPRLSLYGAAAALAALACMPHDDSRAQGFVVPKSAPADGAKLFGQQCSACHSVVAGETRVGPSLADIMGKTAGRSPGFDYSPALARSKVRWSPQTLDRWLTDSAAYIPSSTMGYRQADANKRRAIIAYLESRGGK